MASKSCLMRQREPPILCFKAAASRVQCPSHASPRRGVSCTSRDFWREKEWNTLTPFRTSERASDDQASAHRATPPRPAAARPSPAPSSAPRAHTPDAHLPRAQAACLPCLHTCRGRPRLSSPPIGIGIVGVLAFIWGRTSTESRISGFATK